MAYLRPLVNCLLLVFAWLPVLAYSQALPEPDLPFSFSTAANQSQFKPFMYNNSNYTNANNLAKFSAANDGSFAATANRSVPVGGGRSIPVSARYTAPKAEYLPAIGRFLGKVAGPLAAGVALYDLAKELGFLAKRDAANNVAFDNETFVPGQSGYICESSFYGTQYVHRATGSTCSEAIRQTLQEMVDNGKTIYNKGSSVNLWDCASYPGNTCKWSVYGDYRSAEWSGNWVGEQNTPDQYRYSPATQQDFLDAIANKPGWTATSALPRVVQDAVKSGEQVAMQPDLLTGPAKSPGPSSVTQNSNNTKTITTTENKYSYSPTTVTTTTVSNTTVIDNSTGDILDQSNTDGSPNTEQGIDICTLYPNILSCAELDELPDIDLKTKEIPVSITPDAGWGGGSSCPAPRHVTVQGYDVPIPFDLFCKYAELIRPVLLTFAWLSAAFILVGGVKET